jgi:hypothetical protein
MTRENPSVTVHVIGEYETVSSGFDREVERNLFRKLFWKSNFNKGAQSRFLMGAKGDKRFTLAYIREEIGRRDIVVLLNPTGDCTKYKYRTELRERIKKITETVGKKRMVLAFQDLEAKLSLRISSCCGDSISYLPMPYYDSEGVECMRVPLPAPEEAIAIVAKLLTNNNSA